VIAGSPDRPVYLLTGSDRPKIATALARLERHFASEATSVVSALDTSGEAAVALCNAGSLFGDARLVVVDHVDGARDGDGRRKGGWRAADAEAVAAYLKSPAPATVLALVGEDVKKTTALWKACAKAGDVLEYSVSKKDLPRWVAEQFRQRGVAAEPEACAALVQLVGEDLSTLSTEVEKLATWAAGEPIGEREVAALVAASAELPVYELTEAWAARDAARACRLALEADFTGHQAFNICAHATIMSTPTRELIASYLPGVKDLRDGLDGRNSGYSIANAKKQLGFEPRCSLVD